jgi:hypothetical protein
LHALGSQRRLSEREQNTGSSRQHQKLLHCRNFRWLRYGLKPAEDVHPNTFLVLTGVIYSQLARRQAH